MKIPGLPSFGANGSNGTHFFVQRPRMAMVIAIIVTIVGILSVLGVPVSQFPRVTPPTVSVSCSYAGADATTLATTVGNIIEDAVNGVEGMAYMTSSSNDNGSYRLSVVFSQETDQNMAMVKVQNRVQLIQSQLPVSVVENGISVNTSTTSMLGSVAFFSPSQTLDSIFINNYVDLNVNPVLARIEGVASADQSGRGQYSLRIWVDPLELAARGLTPADVERAIRAQNVQATGGTLGSAPISDNQVFQYIITGRGRLETAEEFGNIIIRANESGLVRVKDVARVELGKSDYSIERYFMGNQPAGITFLSLSSTANALDVMKDVRAKLEELKPQFPGDLTYEFGFDSTLYVAATLEEIFFTMGLTVLIVALVTWLCMGNWRLALIPVITIPISLLGAMIVLNVLGYTANTMTLFALILATGLVVDDAILVVENVERVMHEERLSAGAATSKSMRQVSGAVVATSLVLLSVFVPFAFLSGMTGALYRQFAVTLSAAVFFSTITALTLSPAMCSVLLREGLRKGALLRLVENGLYRTRVIYSRIVTWFLKKAWLALALQIPVIIVAGFLYMERPKGFLPSEDMGAVFIDVALPDAAALGRTNRVMAQVTEILRNTPGVDRFISMSGSGMLSGGAASNSGMITASLKPWEERKDPEMSSFAIGRRLQEQLAAIPGANINIVIPPAIPGLGRTGGVSMYLEAVAGQDVQQLAEAVRSLVVAANADPSVGRAFANFSAQYPRLFLDINRDKAEALGVSVSSIFSTLQSLFSQRYVNDFTLYGKSYRVYVMARPDVRMSEDDILNTQLPSSKGTLVPLRSFATVNTVVGANIVERFNMYPSAKISAVPAPGHSSGEVMSALSRVVREQLPPGYSNGWAELSYQESLAASREGLIFALSFIFVLLFLVAQYESWLLPLAIVLSVIMGALGATVGLTLTGSEVNIYVQIGLVLLIGLASKNAIMIVQFARDLRREGYSIFHAARRAARQRYRAVFMTALSFILGVVPLMLASGAGAVSRQLIGVTVFSGLLAASTIGILFIPSFYFLCQRRREKFYARHKRNRAG